MTYDENYFINIERYAPFSYLHPITQRSDVCKKGVINLIKIKETKYAKRRTEWIFKNIKPNSSLDIGTADGALVKNLLKKGIDSYGTDISKYQINRLKEEFPNRFSYGSVDNLPFNNNSFELVTAFHIMEHVMPSKVTRSIQEIGRVSKKYIVIEHPAEENFHVYVDKSHVSVNSSLKWKNIIIKTVGDRWKIQQFKKATIYKPFFIFLERT